MKPAAGRKSPGLLIVIIFSSRTTLVAKWLMRPASALNELAEGHKPLPLS